MTTVQITLPDQLAQEAQRAGLLAPARLERWLRDQLKTQRVDELFAAMDHMAAVDEPAVMSPEEVAQEIVTMRAWCSIRTRSRQPSSACRRLYAARRSRAADRQQGLF